MPDTSGRIVPPVRPNEWNIGIALNTLSPPWKSITEADLRAVGQQVAVAQRDAFRSAFRAAGEQHHRRCIRVACAPGSRPAPPRVKPARSFARRPIAARTSSSQTKRTSCAMRSTTRPSGPSRRRRGWRSPCARRRCGRPTASRQRRPKVQQARHDAERLQPDERHHRGDRVRQQHATCVRPAGARPARVRAPPTRRSAARSSIGARSMSSAMIVPAPYSVARVAAVP